MFREYEAEDVLDEPTEVSGIATITVTVITGECIHVSYHPAMTVLQLKGKIYTETKHETGKQKLLYNDKELSVRFFLRTVLP